MSLTDNAPCVPNAYTTICTSTIYEMISGLESLALPLYQDFIRDSCCKDLNYFAVFPMQFGDSKYLLYQNDPNGSINFWSVNMSLNNVLTANYLTFNVIPALLVNYRTMVVVKYKNGTFKLSFSVPFLDQLVNTKKVIQNLFNDDTKVYIVYDKIALFFSRIGDDPYYRFVYAGLLTKSLKENDGTDLSLLPTTKFDFANGTLVGLIQHIPYLLYNRYGVQSMNLYPYANYVFSAADQKTNQVVVGGINNYFIQPVSKEKPRFWKASYCFELQYQAPFFKTDTAWGYAPLQVQILIPNTCDYIEPTTGPTYILGFNAEIDPTVVYLGTTQFLNSDNTIITQRQIITFTSDKELVDWYVYPPLPDQTGVVPDDKTANLYYFYSTSTPDAPFIIYRPTLERFVRLNLGALSISDLLYSTLRNQLMIKAYPPSYGATAPADAPYTVNYKYDNLYFLYYGLENEQMPRWWDERYENNMFDYGTTTYRNSGLPPENAEQVGCNSYNDEDKLSMVQNKNSKYKYSYVRRDSENDLLCVSAAAAAGAGNIRKVKYRLPFNYRQSD